MGFQYYFSSFGRERFSKSVSSILGKPIHHRIDDSLDAVLT